MTDHTHLVLLSFEFILIQTGIVDLAIYNTEGMQVRHPLREIVMGEGRQVIQRDGHDYIGKLVDPGVNYCVLKTEKSNAVAKIVRLWSAGL